jgi:hypothetical protein
MIESLLNLKVTKEGDTHHVQVTAVAGDTGGDETFDFDVQGEHIIRTVHFDANEEKPVVVEHHQTGTGLVSVTASPSGKTRNRMLNCDAASDQ